ncbi:MAG TPA: hypothetical protein VMP67_04665, partial [Candidatus Limnocylindria bacterium]|nr:hypothetical protein [Candidatus Limnocylindria bacterium]
DPARLLLLAAAVLLVLGGLLPWAVGLDALGRPDSYRPTQGTAEGVFFIATALLMVYLARNEGMWTSTSRSLQLLPVLVAAVCVAMWIGADSYAQAVIDNWAQGGGSGAKTSAPLVAAAGIGAILLAVLVLELWRPAQVRARTEGLLREWGISRWTAAAVGAALLLGGLGAGLALALAVLVLDAETMVLGVFLAVFGLFIGIGSGLWLVHRLESAARRRAAAHAQPAKGRLASDR